MSDLGEEKTIGDVPSETDGNKRESGSAEDGKEDEKKSKETEEEMDGEGGEREEKEDEKKGKENKGEMVGEDKDRDWEKTSKSSDSEELELKATLLSIMKGKLWDKFQPRLTEVFTDEATARGVVLEELLEKEHIEAFQDAFQDAKGTMTRQQLQAKLKELANIRLREDDFDILFRRMDLNQDGIVNWDEFLTHLILEKQDKAAVEQRQELQLPLDGYPRIIKSRHRMPICRVTFCPDMMENRSTSFLNGKYITLSRDGVINTWSLDFRLERTAQATCPLLKYAQTWITDVACMPDVNIICTSSTERDLRFYDITAEKFDLRVIISSLEYPGMCMHYHFSRDVHNDSCLIVGDMGGNVRCLSFSSIDKGPFRQGSSYDATHKRYEAVVRGALPGMKVTEFRDLHADWVRQVGYYAPMQAFISCGHCSINSVYMCDTLGRKNQYSFHVTRGIGCFTYAEESHLLVTGGPDCILRMWNVFVPKKPISMFQGHHTPIIAIIIQDNGNRLYSMSKDKCIKVWDVPGHACLQTYISMPTSLGERSQLSVIYNPVNRTMVVAGGVIAVLELDRVVDKERSDGFTHIKGVTRALYNPLFKCVVTAGMDSFIMVWDPWLGRRLYLIRKAHTILYYGDRKPVEITAACFDPSFHLLVTGARDGSVKTWNFNMGVCLRIMNIRNYKEVTSVVWIKNRILAVGWNRYVVEFADHGQIIQSKKWALRHTDDVLCTGMRTNQTLATASYNGELILWKLETGQAYRRFSVMDPFTRVLLTHEAKRQNMEGRKMLSAGSTTKLQESIREKARSKIKSKVDSQASVSFELPRVRSGTGSTKSIASIHSAVEQKATIMKAEKQMSRKDEITSKRLSQAQAEGSLSVLAMRRLSKSILSLTSSVARRRSSVGSGLGSRLGVLGVPEMHKQDLHVRRVSVVQLPNVPTAGMRPTAVYALAFFEKRPTRVDTGTLLVACDNGRIQLWSHHPFGGFICDFLSIHMAGDYVTAMTVAEDDMYLITGTSMGYIKIWLMSNYALPEFREKQIHVSMPRLRLQFPFLWKDRVEGRAKRSLRAQKWPLLLSSYRGHILAINQVEYIEKAKIVMTASSDTSVRLWTLSGRYLGTLGATDPWPELYPNNEQPDFLDFHIPPDIKRIGSSTTMKVLKGGNVLRTHFKIVDDSELLRDLPERLRAKATFGQPLSKKFLHDHFLKPLKGHTRTYVPPPDLDINSSYTPVFSYLKCQELSEMHPVPTKLHTSEPYKK